MLKNIDQAEHLREQVKLRDEDEQNEVLNLPPRREVHKHRKTKKRTFQIDYPIINFLAILFFIIIIIALTSPYWLQKL